MDILARPRQSNLWLNAPDEGYHEFLSRNMILLPGLDGRRAGQDSTSRQ